MLYQLSYTGIINLLSRQNVTFPIFLLAVIARQPFLLQCFLISGPTNYESVALPTELHWLGWERNYSEQDAG